ncbi:cell division protein ZipA-like [Procambarus clarkii]|uniref:cell division protein ZipA-like n=1 Tax=Procambarus clarkii TaxID=6728 RepID=UPI003743006E
MAEDGWGGITATDETGDGGGGTEPSERAVFFNTLPGRHVHSQPRKGEPPSTGNRNHLTQATRPKQEVPAPHGPPPPQQEPYQGPHHPPDPHQHQTHHPRTPQRNSSKKKHQPSLHPHIPLPTNEEAKHPYPYANAWGQAVDHRSCHPPQEAPERIWRQAAPQSGEHDPAERQPQQHEGQDRHPQRRQEKEQAWPQEGKGPTQVREPCPKRIGV